MPIAKERIVHLLELYSSREATDAEEQELFQWLNENDNQHTVSEHIHQLIQQFDRKELIPSVDWESLYQEILKKTYTKDIEPVVSRRMLWPRIAVAASIILILGIGVFYLLTSESSKPQIAAIDKQPELPVQNDIQPGTNGAILTLANGRKIVLDTAGNDTLVTQGGIKLLNHNGQLSYNHIPSVPSEEVLYNIMTTTRGRQYQLLLLDGTRVWLNASSSIKYPTTFTGKERTVEITGEAYFEVAHNASKPFNVVVNGMNIHVLGTHFNVNAYDDETTTRTTLLEGSVRVTKDNLSTMLVPGQQAQMNKKGELKVFNDADLQEVVAWKDGLFVMKKADIGSIMRQIARWYDVEIVYQGSIPPGRISGDIPRNMNLSKVLEVMELSGVHFTIEGKKVMVKP